MSMMDEVLKHALTRTLVPIVWDETAKPAARIRPIITSGRRGLAGPEPPPSAPPPAPYDGPADPDDDIDF